MIATASLALLSLYLYLQDPPKAQKIALLLITIVNSLATLYLGWLRTQPRTPYLPRPEVSLPMAWEGNSSYQGLQERTTASGERIFSDAPHAFYIESSSPNAKRLELSNRHGQLQEIVYVEEAPKTSYPIAKTSIKSSYINWDLFPAHHPQIKIN